MNIFKRAFVSVGASIDSFADKLENQEAVAGGLIDEMEDAVVSVRSELIRTQNEIKRFDKLLEQQKSDVLKWTNRAKQSADSDREKALQCVKFIKSNETKIEEVTNELAELRVVERELLTNVSEGEQRLAELRRKKRLLASRQSRAEVTNLARSANGTIAGDADDLFCRWEAKVGRTEGISEHSSTEEELVAQEFRTSEEQEELETLLNEITQG